MIQYIMFQYDGDVEISGSVDEGCDVLPAGSGGQIDHGGLGLHRVVEVISCLFLVRGVSRLATEGVDFGAQMDAHEGVVLQTKAGVDAELEALVQVEEGRGGDTTGVRTDTEDAAKMAGEGGAVGLGWPGPVGELEFEVDGVFAEMGRGLGVDVGFEFRLDAGGVCDYGGVDEGNVGVWEGEFGGLEQGRDLPEVVDGTMKAKLGTVCCHGSVEVVHVEKVIHVLAVNGCFGLWIRPCYVPVISFDDTGEDQLGSHLDGDSNAVEVRILDISQPCWR